MWVVGLGGFLMGGYVMSEDVDVYYIALLDRTACWILLVQCEISMCPLACSNIRKSAMLMNTELDNR
jgi:hypothetical protein